MRIIMVAFLTVIVTPAAVLNPVKRWASRSMERTVAKEEASSRLAIGEERLVLRACHLHRLELQRRDALCAAAGTDLDARAALPCASHDRWH